MDLSTTILWLAILVNIVGHIMAGSPYLKYGEDCDGSFFPFLLAKCEANLVCFPGSFGGPARCLCPTFTVFLKVCQWAYGWENVCWEQCVGSPGRECTGNFAPRGSRLWDSTRMQCVKNADCVKGERRSVCTCKSGYLPFPAETPVACRRQFEVTGVTSGARKTSPHRNEQSHFRQNSNNSKNDEYKRNHSCRWGSHLDLFALAGILGNVLIVLIITAMY